MNNAIVKFKNEIKSFRNREKAFLTQAMHELKIIESFQSPSINSITTVDNIIEELDLFKSFGATYLFKQRLKNIKNIFDFEKSKKDGITKEQFEEIIEKFKEMINTGKEFYTETQTIINAFENDKIKNPINDLNFLLDFIRLTTLTIEETNIILGMAIHFNNEYAKKNKNYEIENIDLITILADYYNKDGSFKYNDDIETYRKTIKLLLKESVNAFNNSISSILLPNDIDLEDLVNLLIENNKVLKIKSTDTTPVMQVPEEHTISPETKEALQELRKYYKNGSIIKLPENLEEFYKILEKSGLDKFETKYIKELINNELEKQNKQTGLLTKEEQSIYEKSLELLSSLDYSNNDIYELKELIKEFQTIIELLKSSADEEDKQFLLSGIPNIIAKLSLICSKYEPQEIKESTNKYIFLLDKDNIPYISKDIDSLDPSYKKLINALIEKINKNNQQQFKKVLSSEKLPYNLVSMYSPKAYVAFIEICPDKYILMGANVARSGYKEIINRLLSNQEAIKEFENNIKDIEKRNTILAEHEEYLPLLTEINSSKLTRKKAKNN